MIEITKSESSELLRRQVNADGGPSPRGLALHFLAVLVVSSSLTGLLAGPRAALSMALGIGLAAMNLVVMGRIIRVLGGASGFAGTWSAAAWALAFPLKLVVLVASAFVLVDRDVAEPVPLAIGFALLPLSGVFLRRAGGVAGTRNS